MVIDPGAEKILCTLEEAGFEAYVVGGCVRDALMGRVPEDWDITTNALPEQVKTLFRKTFDTGIEHGTVTVLENGGSYEVTTYRIDGEYTDHRRPDKVCFASDLYEDVARRDFTINAMAFHPRKGLKDYFEGKADLDRRLIRCVGEPEERFGEDALRMLRAVRFSAKLNFIIDSGTREAICRLAPDLARVSRERILEEVTKTLISDHPEGLREAADTGLLRYFVPEAPEGVKDGSMLDFDTPSKVENKRALRFAALMHPLDPETAGAYLRALKADNELCRRVCRLLSRLGDEAPREGKDMRLWIHLTGRDLMEDLLALRLAAGVDDPETGESLKILLDRERQAPVTLKELAVNGKTVISWGACQGKELGDILEQLLLWVLEDPGLNTEASLKHIYLTRYRNPMQDAGKQGEEA
ncbi:MAG: CCA tRNA nucleotidyltransferase [Lachnospiraceae bacterium]|nr:CCA tRNA nucleotidyltransferase [Lachnospiraceae bacterium]